MGLAFILFILVAVPIGFTLLTWVLVTAYQLVFPEEPRPYEGDPVTLRHQAAAMGAFVPVGTREIREDQRSYFREQAFPAYDYAYGQSEGMPEIWMEDLWRRRN